MVGRCAAVHQAHFIPVPSPPCAGTDKLIAEPRGQNRSEMLLPTEKGRPPTTPRTVLGERLEELAPPLGDLWQPRLHARV